MVELDHLLLEEVVVLLGLAQRSFVLLHVVCVVLPLERDFLLQLRDCLLLTRDLGLLALDLKFLSVHLILELLLGLGILDRKQVVPDSL